MYIIWLEHYDKDMKMREEKLVKWFPREVYDRLPENDRTVLREYRNTYRRIIRREEKIKRILEGMKDDREGLRKWKREFTTLSGSVFHLKKEFVFSVFVVSYKKRKLTYYNLSLKRRGKPTKNIYLGREEVIRNHMSEYFGKKKCLNPKTDWVSELNYSGYNGDLKENILNLILDDPHGFDGKKITLKEVLPLTED
jgi:hypothetical protein